jgi:hypothetical protein
MGGLVFDSNEMNTTMDSNMQFVMPVTNPQLVASDFATLNQMAFQVHYLSKMTQGNSLRADALRSEAIGLLKLIQTEYNLN